MTKSFKPVVEGAREKLRAEPEKARASFEAVSRQTGGLRSEVQTRQFLLTVDEPPALGGGDTGPNPVELILAALASCQEITYRLHADALGIPLEGVSVKVRGDLDLRGLFAAAEDVRPGFQGLTVEVSLVSTASDAELERLRDVVERHCPVLDLLQNATPVAIAAERALAGPVIAAG